jgi:integrase
MARSTVNRRSSHWAHVAGVDFTPHGLRHTAITTVLDAVNGDLRLAARWSRHLSVASLRSYDDRRRSDDRRLTELLSDPSVAESHDDVTMTSSRTT